MNGDPLAHLRGSIRTGEVPGLSGIQGWGICFGDMDDVDMWVYFDAQHEWPGWVAAAGQVGQIEDREAAVASTAEVIGYLGPMQGEIAFRHAQIMRERLAARGMHSEVLTLLDREIAEGQAVLAARITAAGEEHTREVTRIAAQLAALDPITQDVPDVSPAAALSYMTAVVHRDEIGWLVYDDNDDENPMELRCDPERGWVCRYATDPPEQWQAMAVAQACAAVGPLHAGDIVAETRRLRASYAPDVAERIDRELDAARADAYIWMAQALQTHAHQAHVLQRMARHFPEPGTLDLAPG